MSYNTNTPMRLLLAPLLGKSILDEIYPQHNVFTPELFRTDNTTTQQDDTTVIYVGHDVTPDDIHVELSPDKRTLEINVTKSDEENNVTRSIKQVFHSSQEYDHEEMNVELSDGDLIVYAPFIQRKTQDDSTKSITVHHNPQIESNTEETDTENTDTEKSEK